MIDSKAAFSVLELLYDTLDDPQQWKTWLDETCGLLRADGGNLTIASHHRPDQTFLIENCLTPTQFTTYVNEYAVKDWQRAQLENEITGRAKAVSQLSHSEIAAYIDSEYFQQFAKDTPCWMSMGAVFLCEDGLIGNSGFHRRNLDDPFSLEELGLLEDFNSHISRVFQHSQYLRFLEDTIAELGQRRAAIFLLAQDGLVQYANQAASAIANSGGLTVRNRQLVADCPSDTARLHAAIATLLTGNEEGFELGTDLFLPRANNPVPLAVSVTPNYRKTPFYQAGISPIRAVVTVTDPKHQPELCQRILQSLYGLTPRKIEIGEKLVTGLGLPAISEELCVSYHTVRTQVKSMIQKTGVRGQSQLMAFLTCFSD